VPIICALDVHRKQITYKWLDTESGEVKRGHIVPVTREEVRGWLARFQGLDAHFALEATTGWRFIVEEIQSAGFTPHLAEPTETRTRYGRKRRAKTDHADCDHILDLMLANRLPESWIPPHHILELRTRVRLRKAMVDQRREWQQRLQAQLFHQGVPRGIRLTSVSGRVTLADAVLSPAGREVVDCGLRMIASLDAEVAKFDSQLRAFALAQPGCRALMAQLYGVGPIVSTAILAEMGDCHRFSSSDQAVRHAGIDITVWESDGRRSAGHLSRQGPQVLRWALFEAAQCAARRGSPDHHYYRKAKQRLGHDRACLSVARKLCRRAYHILRQLGADALAPVDDVSIQEAA
jgi:transposase